MIRKKKGDIEWLEFNIFADHPHIVHGIFLRHGGVSQHSFSSLNANKYIGDDPKAVEENRNRILKTLSLRNLVSIKAIHGKEIALVDKETQEEFIDYDGLVTQKTDCTLLITHADCQAALFYDPIHQAIANVHAGWRGQVKNIYKETILKMGEAFGTNPKDLLVGISPSLGPQNSEFINYEKELPQHFWPYQIKPTYFDLWSIAEDQLQECGVSSKNIEIARMDTFAHPNDLFSCRRNKSMGIHGNSYGCHATVISISRHR